LICIGQKIGDILHLNTKAQPQQDVKTLEGIWEDVKINETDFKEAKGSLFKTSL